MGVAVLPLQVMAITLEVDLAAKEAVAMAVVATEQVVVEAGVAQEDPQEDQEVSEGRGGRETGCLDCGSQRLCQSPEQGACRAPALAQAHQDSRGPSDHVPQS